MPRLEKIESVRKVETALDVAPPARGGQLRTRRYGHPPHKTAGAHEVWLLQRIKTPFARHGLMAEPAGHGSRVEYRTVWAFVPCAGYS